MSDDLNLLTQPTFDSITVVLHPDRDAEAAGVRLAALLGGSWSSTGIHRLDRQVLDLVGGPEALSQGEAWDLAYRVSADPAVKSAEPVFEVASAVDATNTPLAARSEGFGAPLADPSDPFWPHVLIGINEAWALLPPGPGGKKLGAGIVVGHPDSGYVPNHPEMDGAIDMARSKDFVDTTSTSAANAEGLHGLGTGSVIVSRDNRANRAKSVTGIAPAATLIPYRVAKKRFFVPVPVLFRSGMRRLRLALLAAIEEGCHVVSISLGWLRNEGVHRALRQAVDKDIIVCAAAGNYTSSLVVWPAAYEEAIALAACNVRREAWAGSAHGPKVDVTAPGEDVWRAVPGDEYVAPSSGTSYAAAITAGLAALWLAFHGREAVLLRARALGINAAELFRRYLRATASEGPGDGFGRGIVDARALLDKAIDADDLECFEVAASSKVPETPSTLLESAFDLLPPEEVRRRAAGLLSVPAAELPERIAGRETEVLAALILDLAARRAMTAPLGATTKALESFEAKDLPLSNTLRAQLYAAG